MTERLDITSTVARAQRPALEQLLFFNINQHRVRVGIQQSIETYGVPEIIDHDGALSVRVGDIDDVQTLFAVNSTGRPVGVAVFARLAQQRFVVLHLGVEARFRDASEANSPVLLKLMHGIRSVARRADVVDRIELVYKHQGSVSPG